jgi:hypothetical protein
MSRRRSTSSSHNQPNQNYNHKPCHYPQNDQIIRPTSELYKQAYLTLINNDSLQDDVPHNTPAPNYHSIPPPHRNNLKPVNSPLRRLRSTTEEEISELDDFELDPTTKIVHNHRKKTKTNSNINIKQNNSNEPCVLSPSEQSRIQHEQHKSSTTTNQQTIINSSTINVLTNEAKSFAQTRYPFPPFIIRFSTPLIHEQKIVDELCKLLKENKELELELCGYRKATTKCSSNECDLLLFVKNSHSFAILYDETNWPQSLLGLGLTYTRPSFPSIPPQLSLIVKNVSLSIDFVDFTNDVKATYTNVRNVTRMKNRNQLNIKLVKLEFSEPNQRDEILNRRKIFVNSLTYDVDEYLAPARVLICSKCMGLGHFRKQCKQKDDTCKKCGITYNDIKDHSPTCSQLHCIHCQGDHMSNDMKCPEVKQFPADLTKFLLSPAIHANPQSGNFHLTSTSFPPMNSAQRSTIHCQDFNNNFSDNNFINNNDNFYHYNSAHRTPHSNINHWTSNTNPTSSLANKIDNLVISMNQVNALLKKIVITNDKFENFMNDKIINDEIISNKIDNVIKHSNNQAANIAQHEIKITRYGNVLMKIVFPFLDEISLFLSNTNIDKHGGTLDADFKSKINRMRAQLNNARTSKDF